MKKLLAFALLIALSATQTSYFAQGNEGYNIKVKISSLPDTTLYLSYFYAKNYYYKDTVRTDSKGLAVFQSNEPVEEGMFSIVLGNRKVLDFFLIERNFTMETDTVATIKNMKIKGSRENELFYEYMSYLGDKEVEVKPIQKNLKSDDAEVKAQAKADLAKLDDEVNAYIENFIATNGEYFVAKFIKGMREVEVPDPPKDENGVITDSSFQYRYFREHFFDNIDFSDARYLRTPVYHQRLSSWIQKYTYQIPDSLYPAIDMVVEKSRANYDLFRYTVSWITNTYEKSKIMGMDAIFVHMAENYYLTDDVDWVDSTQENKIKSRYKKLKPLLLGKVAPNIVLQDTSEKNWYNLHKIDAEYTLVYIWSPTCGHCKKVTPKMHDLYLKYKEYGFEVFAVGTEYENVEWLKYIKAHNLTWINVSDNPENPNNIKGYPLNFRANYDVYSTPKIYLLDKDKKIVAKRIEDKQLDDFLGRAFGLKKGGSNDKMTTDLEE